VRPILYRHCWWYAVGGLYKSSEIVGQLVDKFKTRNNNYHINYRAIAMNNWWKLYWIYWFFSSIELPNSFKIRSKIFEEFFSSEHLQAKISKMMKPETHEGVNQISQLRTKSRMSHLSILRWRKPLQLFNRFSSKDHSVYLIILTSYETLK